MQKPVILGWSWTVPSLGFYQSYFVTRSIIPFLKSWFSFWVKNKIDRRFPVGPQKVSPVPMELHIYDHVMESLPEEGFLPKSLFVHLIEIGGCKNLQTLPSQIKKLGKRYRACIQRASKGPPAAASFYLIERSGGVTQGFGKTYGKNVGSGGSKTNTLLMWIEGLLWRAFLFVLNFIFDINNNFMFCVYS